MLPKLSEGSGRPLIVKIGGGPSVQEHLDAVLADFAALPGQKLLVHGANHEASELSRRLGKEPETLRSPSGFESRRTDRETLEILMMAYAGLANKRIVEKLQRLGVPAVGLSGLDGRIWEGERKPYVKAVVDGKVKIIRDDLTGRVEQVNTHLLRLLLEGGYVPVLTIPAASVQGEAMNVDNDRAVAVLAGALGAQELVVLLEAPGLLAKFPDESTRIPRLAAAEVERAIEGTGGRMKKKMLGVKEALDRGVLRVCLGDFRRERPIAAALAGEGTVIAAGARLDGEG